MNHSCEQHLCVSCRMIQHIKNDDIDSINRTLTEEIGSVQIQRFLYESILQKNLHLRKLFIGKLFNYPDYMNDRNRYNAFSEALKREFELAVAINLTIANNKNDEAFELLSLEKIENLKPLEYIGFQAMFANNTSFFSRFLEHIHDNCENNQTVYDSLVCMFIQYDSKVFLDLIIRHLREKKGRDETLFMGYMYGASRTNKNSMISVILTAAKMTFTSNARLVFKD